MRYTFIAMICVFFIFYSEISVGEKSNLKWQGFNQAVKKGIQQKKNVIVFFNTNWCRYCRKMIKETLSSKRVKKIMNQYFILCKVDLDKSDEKIKYNGKTYTVEEFSSGLGVQGLPTTAFIDKKGKFIAKLPGFIPPDTFIYNRILKKDACYNQKISFQEFIKRSKKCPATVSK